MTKIEITKKVVSNVAIYGAGIITYAIIRNNLPNNLPLHKKASTFVAAYVIGGVVADAVEAQTGKIVDSFVEIYENVKKKN